MESWRAEVRQELKTNALGFLNSKKAKLAQSKELDTFPNIEILMLYARPVTSEFHSSYSSKPTPLPGYNWDKEPDLGKLGALCERKFEWGTKEQIVKRFRTVVWEGAVQRILRRAVLDLDCGRPSTPTRRSTKASSRPASPSKRMIARHFSSQQRPDSDSDAMDEDRDEDELIISIKGKRSHATMDGLEEYRLEVNPRQLVKLTKEGILGVRHSRPNQQSSSSSAAALPEDEEMFDLDEDEDDSSGNERKKKGGPKKPPPDPDSAMRMWMPECMVKLVEPRLVADFEEGASKKREAKARKDARKGEKAASGGMPASRVGRQGKSGGSTKAKSLRRVMEEESGGEEEEMEATEDFSDVFGLKPKSSSKPRQRTIIDENSSSTDTNPDVDDAEDDRRTLVLSSSPARPLRPSKTKAKHVPPSQGRIDNRMETGKLCAVASSSSASKTGTTGEANEAATKKKSGSVLEALGSMSPSSALSSASSSRAGSVPPPATEKQDPKPFPMFHPLERARARGATPGVGANLPSPSSTTSAPPPTGQVSSSSASNLAPSTVTNGNAVLKAKSSTFVVNSDSDDEELPTRLTGTAAEPSKPRKSVIEISSSSSNSESDSELPSWRVPTPPQPQKQTQIQTITLPSSPNPSSTSPRRMPHTGQQPQSPTKQTRIDSVFKASKALSSTSKASTLGKPRPLPMIRKKVFEFTEEDVIELD